MSTIVLPAEIIDRWQRAIERGHYMNWLSFATYLRALSRLTVEDLKFADAGDLLILAQVAHQLALDMEPEKVTA